MHRMVSFFSGGPIPQRDGTYIHGGEGDETNKKRQEKKKKKRGNR